MLLFNIQLMNNALLLNAEGCEQAKSLQTLATTFSS